MQMLPTAALSCAESFEKCAGAVRAPAALMIATGEGLEALTEKIIGCAIEVHRILGPGLLESVYRECMMIEMRGECLRFVCEQQIALDHKGQRVRGALKLDLLVERCVVVELKAVERIHPVHSAQVITYLKLTGCPAGLLMNFNSTTLKAGLKRLDHPNLYVKKKA